MPAIVDSLEAELRRYPQLAERRSAVEQSNPALERQR